jgi:hypothetical protein
LIFKLKPAEPVAGASEKVTVVLAERVREKLPPPLNETVGVAPDRAV